MGNTFKAVTKETYFELHNDTNQDIINTYVNKIDMFDFDRTSRPDLNLSGHRIPANSQLSEKIVVKAHARNCSFTMSLIFSDGTTDEFCLSQKNAIGQGTDFWTIKTYHVVTGYRSDDKTFVVKVKNTEAQLRNEEAEEKNKEGEAELKKKQYNVAIKIFDEALELANQNSTKYSIETNKSEAFTQIAKQNFQEGFLLEADDKSNYAEPKFEEAVTMFRRARNLNESAECQENFKLASLKSDGNMIFNHAKNLEKQASEQFEKLKNRAAEEEKNYTKSEEFNCYNAVRNMYKEVLEVYEQVVQMFEEGAKKDKNFNDGVKLAKEDVEKTCNVVNEIGKILLEIKSNHLKMNDNGKNTASDM